MRLPATQSLTDGELFWIIEHGVRFTGMPGWSTGTKEGEVASCTWCTLFATCRTLQRPSWSTWRGGIRVHLKKSVKTSKPSGFFVARTSDEHGKFQVRSGRKLGYCYGGAIDDTDTSWRDCDRRGSRGTGFRAGPRGAPPQDHGNRVEHRRCSPHGEDDRRQNRDGDARRKDQDHAGEGKGRRFRIESGRPRRGRRR